MYLLASHNLPQACFYRLGSHIGQYYDVIVGISNQQTVGGSQ